MLLIIIPTTSLLIQKYIKKASVPMFMGYAFLIVATGSMNGTINQGDMVIVKKTDDYSLGDIVTYVETDGNLPVTHRIINYGPEEGMFITKGDANPTADVNPVSVEQVAGEVVVVIPKVGIFFDWFIHGGGIVYIIAMVAIAIAGVYFWNLTKPEPDTNTNPTQDNNESQE